MKKSLITIALISIFSAPVLAIDNGMALDWSKNDDLVQMDCSGTILAGKWVLTAEHCKNKAAQGVKTVHGLARVESVINYTATDYALDIGLWKLAAQVDTLKTTFLSPRHVAVDERLRITGFGSGNGLAYAEQLTTPSTEGRPEWFILKMDGKGTTAAGDSGAPYSDSEGFIVGIHDWGAIDQETGINASGSRLEYAKDWILETINGWHYPTLANTSTTGGSVTIEVQSLHADSVIDNATASGDATITGGTCSGATVQPYDICTYTVASNGYEGTVTLDGDQKITINKGRTKPVTPPTPEPEQGSSGGALGSLGLLFGVIVGFTRRKTTR